MAWLMIIMTIWVLLDVELLFYDFLCALCVELFCMRLVGIVKFTLDQVDHDVIIVPALELCT
jgi:hypothetical protein